MSYPLISLPKGLTWNYTKTPKFQTTMQAPQSGRHPAFSTLQQSTIFDLALEYEYLAVKGLSTANDFEYLKSFYEAMRGAFGWFLFDPSEYGLEPMTVSADLTQLCNGFSGIASPVNYLLNSNQFNASPWTTEAVGTTPPVYQEPCTGPTGIPGQFWSFPAVPNVGSDFSALTQSATISSPSVAGNTFTFSVWMYCNPTAASFDIRINNAANTEAFDTVVTLTPATWTRVSVSHTFAASTTGIQVSIMYFNGQPAVSYIGIFNGQLELGPSPGPTAITTSAPALPQSTFSLWRSTSVMGGGAVTLLERIQNITLLDGIYLNGSLSPVSSSTYTTTNFPATVTFNTGLPGGTEVAWAGNYNYLAHFSEDTADFEEFFYQLFRMKTLKMETINL